MIDKFSKYIDFLFILKDNYKLFVFLWLYLIFYSVV